MKVRNEIQKTKCKEAKKTVVGDKSETQKDDTRLAKKLLSKDEENILGIYYDLEFYSEEITQIGAS